MKRYWNGIEKTMKRHQKDVEKTIKRHWKDVEMALKRHWKDIEKTLKIWISGSVKGSGLCFSLERNKITTLEVTQKRFGSNAYKINLVHVLRETKTKHTNMLMGIYIIHAFISVWSRTSIKFFLSNWTLLEIIFWQNSYLSLASETSNVRLES